MDKNEQFRRGMEELTKRLDHILIYIAEPSEYLRGYDHAVDVINRFIKGELEATK